MSGYSVEQQDFISEYRVSHNLGYVISDEAVLELIKKDIESGKIPAGFAVLAQDAATQRRSAEISLFKQDITNSNYGLEVEKISKPVTTVEEAKKVELELDLTSRVEDLIKEIEKAERNNGFIGKAWSGIKDLFNTHSSIKRVKEIRSKEEQLLEELKNGSKKLEEVFKELTGAEVTENNIEQF